MQEVFLNNNASTKVDPEVLDAMLPYFCEHYGNPSNLHSFGREAKEAIEQAREQVADFLNAKPEEIYFTSGGTESNNLAIKGILRANIDHGNHIITSKIEHDSVLRTIEFLEKMRYIETDSIAVDEFGTVVADQLEQYLTNNTILVSIMHSNNEVGTIQPIKKLTAIAHNKEVYFHTDAVASAGKIPIDVADLDVDLLTLSAHKFHGPKGVGCLYIKESVKIEKIIYGGEQERGMRAGTENLAGIVGLGKAAHIAKNHLNRGGPQKIENLRNHFEAEITSRINDIKINGHPTQRYCSILNVSFAAVNHQQLIESLDQAGIKVSSGSVCEADQYKTSYVLQAMNVREKYLNNQVRFGLSKYTTQDEINYTIDVLVNLVKHLRSNKKS